jgi:hypothetical protein
MEFLDRWVIADWCRERGIRVEGENDVAIASSEDIVESLAYGQAADPEGQEFEVASHCVRRLHSWDECLFWITQWGVWPSSENWPKYYTARGAHGERRSLDAAPAQVFRPDEAALLIEFTTLVLENAWDAHMIPVTALRPTGQRVLISHDEWLEIRGARQPSTDRWER